MNIQTHKISNFIELEKYNFKSRTNLEPNLLWVRSFHKSYNPIMAVPEPAKNVEITVGRK